LKEITHGLDASLGNEISDLVGFLETTGGSVRESPTCFLLGLEVGVLEDVDKRRNDVTAHQPCL
jgi:hypothetical protein